MQQCLILNSKRKRNNIKDNNISCNLLNFLFIFEFKGLGSSNAEESLMFAFRALEFQSDFLCYLSFLLKNWFLLTTEPPLLVVVSSFSLSKNRVFSFFILTNFMLGVGFTIIWAVGLSNFLKSNHDL